MVMMAIGASIGYLSYGTLTAALVGGLAGAGFLLILIAVGSDD